MRVVRVRLFALLVVAALAACASQPASSQQAASAVASTPQSGNVQIGARTMRFETTAVDVPAGKAFKIDFDNKDAATIHDIDIHRTSASGELVFDGATVSGPAKATYDIPALTAGTYVFVCSVHPGDMSGTLKAS
jgi:plastocyanin